MQFHLPKPLHGWRALAGEVGITVCRWGTGRMHLHMPKPLHGGREFIHEITIAVLGVLIALGANQNGRELGLEQQGAPCRDRYAPRACGSVISSAFLEAEHSGSNR